jgi:hypothetical protein
MNVELPTICRRRHDTQLSCQSFGDRTAGPDVSGLHVPLAKVRRASFGPDPRRQARWVGGGLQRSRMSLERWRADPDRPTGLLTDLDA